MSRRMNVVIRTPGGDNVNLQGTNCEIVSKTLATRFGKEFDEVIECEEVSVETSESAFQAGEPAEQKKFGSGQLALISLIFVVPMVAVSYWLLELVGFAPYLYFEEQEMWVEGSAHQLFLMLLILMALSAAAFYAFFRIWRREM